jgi:predicted Zn-dependent peptidase
MYQKYQLKNKANIFLVPQKDAKSTTVLVMFPIGSRYESEKVAGVSHFIEHMMFKGTKKRPDTLTLTREIDRLGAHYNAFTSKEYTGYFIKADGKYLEVCLDILSDMLFNSKFEEKEMKKEKTVVVEEIRMYNDNPLMDIGNVFEKLLYENPLGRDIAGSEKTVLNYSYDEVMDFRNKYYIPSNMTVVVAGKIDKLVKQKLEKYFGKNKSKVVENKIFELAKYGLENKEKRLVVKNRKTDQVQLMLGFPGFDHNFKDNPVLTVLNTILGGSMSSRLFIEIREKRGLAYLVRSGEENYRDAGYFYVRVGLEAKNINDTLKVIKSEMNKMKSKGVTNKELQDAKTHLRGSLTLSLEDSSVEAGWYAHESLFADKLKTPEQKLKEIEKVTNKEIMKMAKQVFDWNKIRIAVIGDVKKENIKF